jgi:hypothetical protein
MNLSDLKLDQPVIIHATNKVKIKPGQKWANKNDFFTVMKKYYKFWIIKNKFGDKKRIEPPSLIKKITTEKFTLEPMNFKSMFISEVIPIAKKYFNPIFCSILLSGIGRLIRNGKANFICTSGVDVLDQSADVGVLQNTAVSILTNICADLNVLSRETFVNAPAELRDKSIQVTNEIRELLELVVKKLPPLN